MENIKNVLVMAERENKTVYRDGDRTIKVFKDNNLKSDVMNEAFNQAVIEELGMNVPAFLEIRLVDGKLVTVSQYVEGRTLDEVMKEDKDSFAKYLDMFVSLQIEFHSKETTALTRLRDKLHQQIRKCDLPATVRYDLHTRLDNMPLHHKVCHGDFNPSNVILGDDGKMYILDWSHATQGNASGDAIMTYLLFRLSGKEDIAEEYLTLFSEKSGTSRENLERWIPMVAASHSTECAEGEKEFLLSLAEEYTYKMK